MLNRPLAREIRGLAERFRDRPVFLDDVVQTAHGRGYALFLVLLSLPFSNFFPALTVVLLASGALKQDGLCFLAGCLAFCLSAAYFTLLAVGGVKAVERLIGA